MAVVKALSKVSLGASCPAEAPRSVSPAQLAPGHSQSLLRIRRSNNIYRKNPRRRVVVRCDDRRQQRKRKGYRDWTRTTHFASGPIWIFESPSLSQKCLEGCACPDLDMICSNFFSRGSPRAGRALVCAPCDAVLPDKMLSEGVPTVELGLAVFVGGFVGAATHVGCQLRVKLPQMLTKSSLSYAGL